jgi:hypothetical protein
MLDKIIDKLAELSNEYQAQQNEIDESIQHRARMILGEMNDEFDLQIENVDEVNIVKDSRGFSLTVPSLGWDKNVTYFQLQEGRLYCVNDSVTNSVYLNRAGDSAKWKIVSAKLMYHSVYSNERMNTYMSKLMSCFTTQMSLSTKLRITQFLHQVVVAENHNSKVNNALLNGIAEVKEGKHIHMFNGNCLEATKIVMFKNPSGTYTSTIYYGDRIISRSDRASEHQLESMLKEFLQS